MSLIRTRLRSATYVQDWLNVFPFNYTFPAENNLIINSGYTGTTDWVDTTPAPPSAPDGLANSWSKLGTSTPSIINGTNGFSAYAQRLLCGATAGIYGLGSNDPNVTDARSHLYKIKFKYRSTDRLTVAWLVQTNGWYKEWTFNSNTGNCIQVEVTYSPQYNTFRGLFFKGPASSGTHYIEIDEVAVIQQ